MKSMTVFSLLFLSFSLQSAYSASCTCAVSTLKIVDNKITNIEPKLNQPYRTIKASKGQTCEDVRLEYNQDFWANKDCVDLNRAAIANQDPTLWSYDNGMLIEGVSPLVGTNCDDRDRSGVVYLTYCKLIEKKKPGYSGNR